MADKNIIDEIRSVQRKHESKQKEIINFLAFQSQTMKAILRELQELNRNLKEDKDGNTKRD